MKIKLLCKQFEDVFLFLLPSKSLKSLMILGSFCCNRLFCCHHSLLFYASLICNGNLFCADLRKSLEDFKFKVYALLTLVWLKYSKHFVLVDCIFAIYFVCKFLKLFIIEFLLFFSFILSYTTIDWLPEK